MQKLAFFDIWNILISLPVSPEITLTFDFQMEHPVYYYIFGFRMNFWTCVVIFINLWQVVIFFTAIINFAAYLELL